MPELEQHEHGFILPALPDSPNWELPVAKGRVWNLTNGNKRPRTNEDYYRFECPVDPDAVDDKGLERVQGFFQQVSYGNWDVDPTKLDRYGLPVELGTTEQFQKWLCNHLLYCLSGHFDKRRPNLMNLYGQTRNAKTTIAETIQAILGDYSGPLARAVIFDPPNEIRGHQAHMFTIKDKRCVVLTEPGDQAGNPNTIKQVLGGDQISARNLNSQTIKFRSYAKILIPSNEIFNVAPGPAMTDVKVVYVKFKAFFTSNPDPNKPNEFKEDPTLEAWLESAQGKACFVQYLINQYSPELLPIPYCVAKFHKMVVADGEPSAETFIKEFLIATEAGRGNVTAEATYNKYKAWCANKLKQVSCKQRDFSEKLRSKFGDNPCNNGARYFPCLFNQEAYIVAMAQPVIRSL